MASVQELVNAVCDLKTKTEGQSMKYAACADAINLNLMKISALLKGNQNSGPQAIGSLGAACQSMKRAAASIESLSRVCDECFRSHVQK